MELGLVDLSESLDDQVRAMSSACEGLGFFRIPLSVVPPEIAAAAWETAAEFFALPEELKREVEFPEPGYPYGYSPFGFETLARSLDDSDARPDAKESLSVGPDCGGLTVDASEQEWIRSPSLCPRLFPRCVRRGSRTTGR